MAPVGGVGTEMLGAVMFWGVGRGTATVGGMIGWGTGYCAQAASARTSRRTAATRYRMITCHVLRRRLARLIDEGSKKVHGPRQPIAQPLAESGVRATCDNEPWVVGQFGKSALPKSPF